MPPGASKTFSGHHGQVYARRLVLPTASRSPPARPTRSFRQWDVEKGTQVRAVEKAHENVVYAVAYSPKGDLIATGGDDKLVKFWNPADGKELRKGAGHGAAIYCVVFSPDGTKLASGSVDKTIRLWNVADGKEINKLDGHPDDVYSSPSAPTASGSPRSATAATCSSGTCDGAKPLFHQKVGPNTMTYGVAWSPDGKQLAVAASDNKAYLFNVP